jgi:hypothetical protein
VHQAHHVEHGLLGTGGARRSEALHGTLHGPSNAAIDGHIIYENNTHLNTPSVAWRFFKSFW